ncbi:MAG: hypothetical protein ACI9WC_000687 [Arenicella sp.]|jgi:hypothetical protein
MFKKSRTELETRNEVLEKELGKKEHELAKVLNQTSTLLANARRWSRKFQNPLYSVPTKVIAQMERETEHYKQRTRAKLDEYAAKNAVLLQKVVELQHKDMQDSFGEATGNSEMDFQFATSHSASHITPEDREEVELELSDLMKERLAKFSK